MARYQMAWEGLSSEGKKFLWWHPKSVSVRDDGVDAVSNSKDLELRLIQIANFVDFYVFD